MKIFGALFYVFALVITLANAGDHYRLPTSVPTAEQQCISRGHIGICSDRGPHPRTSSICNSIYCARPNGQHTTITAALGTICGSSSICRYGICTQIPRDKMPSESGSRRSASCNPTRSRA